MMRTDVRKRFRLVHDVVFGPHERSVIERLVASDPRWDMFRQALDYVNSELVPGDIVEFGVYGGLSLALLAKAHSSDDRGIRRRIVGFDSFEGLPASEDQHARWTQGSFASNLWWHPTLKIGDTVSPQAVADLFEASALPAPEIHVGLFTATLPHVIPDRCPAVALAHVDCDLYESTRDVLEGVAPALQDGSVLLFDDWFLFRGDSRKGEARAFNEFLARRPEWGCVPYRLYGTCCNSFIMYRR